MVPVQRFVAGRIRADVPGPSEAKRKAGQSLLWGEVPVAAPSLDGDAKGYEFPWG